MNNSKICKKAKQYVNKLLVPLEKHYYHSYHHAIEVMERAKYLWEKEWLSNDEVEMIALAWLFHDTGFVIKYDKNEPIWAKIAENYLKRVFYPEDKIKTIKRIILATDPDYKTPTDLYEKIIKDADLDNLWRDDFFTKNNSLKKEIELIKNIKIKDPEWKHWSLDFLKFHKYQTITQQIERNKLKNDNLKKMLKELEESDI